jgi:hypothetical protein
MLLLRCCSDACFATVLLEIRNELEKKRLAKPARLTPLAIATIQLQRNAIDPVLYATTGDKRCASRLHKRVTQHQHLHLTTPTSIFFGIHRAAALRLTSGG